MKKIKSILISTLLVFTLCMLTACGKDNNAADEVPNATTDDNTDNVGDGTADDNMADNADDVNDGTAGTITDDAQTPEKADGEKVLKERYQVQLDYYGRALTQLTGKKVKEKWIYSFGLRRAIQLS